MSDVTRLIARAREIMAFSEDAQVIGELARELEKAQPRIITTVEELDALVEGSVITYNIFGDEVYQKLDRRDGIRWYAPGDELDWRSLELILPATLLNEPKAEETK